MEDDEALKEKARGWRCRGNFPGGPVVRTSPSNADGVGSIPGQEAKISHGANKTKALKKKNSRYRDVKKRSKYLGWGEGLGFFFWTF